MDLPKLKIIMSNKEIEQAKEWLIDMANDNEYFVDVDDYVEFPSNPRIALEYINQLEMELHDLASDKPKEPDDD
jgi:hypothetical protein